MEKEGTNNLWAVEEFQAVKQVVELEKSIGKQMYVVLDKRAESFVVQYYEKFKTVKGEGYVSFDEAFASDIKRLKERNTAYKRAEEIGAIILKTK